MMKIICKNNFPNFDLQYDLSIKEIENRLKINSI